VEQLRADADARARITEQARLATAAEIIESARAQENAERLRAQAAALARAEAEEAAREQEEASIKAVEAERLRVEDEARRQEAEAARQVVVEEALRQEAQALRQAEDEARSAAAETAKRADEEARQRAAEEDRAAREARTRSSRLPEEEAAPSFTPEPRVEEVPTLARKSSKVLGIAALIALGLALILFFVNLPNRPIPPETALPNKIEKPTAPQQSAPQQGAPQQQSTSQQNTPQPLNPPRKDTPQTEQKAALYLEVPPNQTATEPEPFVYTVVEGDNLWNIAKRFTGDPFNYPRVAQDNRIATPDLIVPGQKIELRQQWPAGTAPQTAAPAGD
jgi:nucleoid-associated protein YgaU